MISLIHFLFIPYSCRHCQICVCVLLSPVWQGSAIQPRSWMWMTRLHVWLPRRSVEEWTSVAGPHMAWAGRKCWPVDQRFRPVRTRARWSASEAATQSHVNCHRVNSMVWLNFWNSKPLSVDPLFAVWCFWDAPKSMHTLEVDICILKTCLEVIICRSTIIILLSKVKYKMYASMYIIVHKI